MIGDKKKNYRAAQNKKHRKGKGGRVFFFWATLYKLCHARNDLYNVQNKIYMPIQHPKNMVLPLTPSIYDDD